MATEKRTASADPAPRRRWTIKRKSQPPYSADQYVNGPDTDWIEVVEAATLDRLVASLERIANGEAFGRCSADVHDECGCAALEARSTLASQGGRSDG